MPKGVGYPKKPKSKTYTVDGKPVKATSAAAARSKRAPKKGEKHPSPVSKRGLDKRAARTGKRGR